MDELDSNRLEEFRQLRQEVRHSEEYLIVGINVAKDRHHAFFEKPVGSGLGYLEFFIRLYHNLDLGARQR